MIGVAVQMDIEDVSPLVAGRICKLCVRLREIGIVAGMNRDSENLYSVRAIPKVCLVTLL